MRTVRRSCVSAERDSLGGLVTISRDVEIKLGILHGGGRVLLAERGTPALEVNRKRSRIANHLKAGTYRTTRDANGIWLSLKTTENVK